MKVWLVVDDPGPYGSSTVMGAFSSDEKARAYIKASEHDLFFEVHEMEIDSPEDP